jgi:dipeptidase
MDLLRLALERAATAEEAVAVIQALNAEFGQGGSCGYEDRGFRYFSTFLIADARGAFVLETAGRETAVERVTSGVRSISNGLTIPDFARAHSDVVKTGVSACRLRRARTEQLGAGVSSAREVAAVLRDHGATTWPDYEWHRGAMRAPCLHAGGLLAASQTTASLVVELTAERFSAWATATSAPCLGVFKPVTLAPLDLGPTPGREPDASLWWAHERLHRAVMKDPARLAPLFLAERDALEARAFSGDADAQTLWNEARTALGTWTERVRAASGADLRPWAARRYWAARRAV